MKPIKFRIIFYSIVGAIAIFLCSVIFVSVKFLKEEQKALLLDMWALNADEIRSIKIIDDALEPEIYNVYDYESIKHFVDLANNADQNFAVKGRFLEYFTITINFKSGSVMTLNGILRNRKTLYVNDENVGYEVRVSNVGTWFSKHLIVQR